MAASRAGVGCVVNTKRRVAHNCRWGGGRDDCVPERGGVGPVAFGARTRLHQLARGRRPPGLPLAGPLQPRVRRRRRKLRHWFETASAMTAEMPVAGRHHCLVPNRRGAANRRRRPGSPRQRLPAGVQPLASSLTVLRSDPLRLLVPAAAAAAAAAGVAGAAESEPAAVAVAAAASHATAAAAGAVGTAEAAAVGQRRGPGADAQATAAAAAAAAAVAVVEQAEGVASAHQSRASSRRASRSGLPQQEQAPVPQQEQVLRPAAAMPAFHHRQPGAIACQLPPSR